ncbi:UNVERIFIED_CONTAM: Tabersonine-19-hydroxy-O-acetyltransferase [Sesamum angustifolium]|uniref:Tabersonine-19-hydroxy-O-acetyltransferase n=1 Tax=Sesamum angustifolium TaxID=2727405 RepID=A0AAW2M8C7_9LAMI
MLSLFQILISCRADFQSHTSTFTGNPHSSSLIDGSLKESLAQCLRHFYPFAGRISDNPKSGEPEIICNNSGALVVEAQASISLDEFDFYNLNKSLQGKLVSVDHHFPVQVQITSYICGGISMTFTFDHALGDASAFSKFLVAWSEIAMKKPISCSPDHSRSLRARFPPTYDPSLDGEFVSCTMEEICKIPTFSILLKRLYYIDESSINRLQRLASANGNKRTKIEAFSAYIWKVMANAIDKNHECCKIGWNLIDWVECHRPGLMISKNVLGLGGPALVISSGRRFPVAELDFGFGSPVLGTVCSTIERLGVGYINQRQSAGRDGSWTVSAILWPEMWRHLNQILITYFSQ